jgi:hypothetical protein
MQNWFVRSWLIGTVLLASCASGGASKAIRPTSPFLESDAPLFEDGVDLVGDPSSLSGKWAEDYAIELRDRVNRSDLIALLTVTTVRSDVSPSGHTTHWLVAQVGDVFKGKYEGELSLASSDDAIGFDSVDRERGNILKKPLVVFAKWTKDPTTGAVRPHWHLAAGTRDVVDAVRLQISGAPPPTQTEIIEHTE